MTQRLSYLVLAVLSFLVTALFAGWISHLIPSPAEFIAALIAAAATGFVTLKLTSYRGWPVAMGLLLVLLMGMASSVTVKKMIFIASSEPTVAISPSLAAQDPKQAYFEFENAELLYDKTGYHFLEHYGDHHYYVIPIVSSNSITEPVQYFTWVRTKEAQEQQQMKRLLPETRSYGIRIRESAVKVNTARAIEDFKTRYALEVVESPVIIHWGISRSLQLWWPKLWRQIKYFSFLLALALLSDYLISFFQQKRAKRS